MSKSIRQVIKFWTPIPLSNLLVVAGLALPIWSAVTATSLRAAIIGADNLREWHEEPDVATRNASRATAVLVQKSRDWLLPVSDRWKLSADVPDFERADGVCRDERFTGQPAPGDCSGFLAGPDLLVTAHHCVGALGGCRNLQVVFDFFVPSPGQATFDFHGDSVFQCADVVASDEGQDWAVLGLDREVRDRAPLRIVADRVARGLQGTPVSVWSHPRGLPLKIAGGAMVREPSGFIPPEWSQDYFEADLDVFGGSSGGPVVNSVTGEVEGILVTGFGEFEDPETDPADGRECRRLRRMPYDEATMPWVSRMRSIPVNPRANSSF